LLHATSVEADGKAERVAFFFRRKPWNMWEKAKKTWKIWSNRENKMSNVVKSWQAKMNNVVE